MSASGRKDLSQSLARVGDTHVCEERIQGGEVADL